MEFLIDILIDCVHDTWAMLPLLFITYCIIEVFERKQTSASDEKIFFGLQRFGPLIGALVGLIPQCGFSVLAAMLFVQRNIGAQGDKGADVGCGRPVSRGCEHV